MAIENDFTQLLVQLVDIAKTLIKPMHVEVFVEHWIRATGHQISVDINQNFIKLAYGVIETPVTKTFAKFDIPAHKLTVKYDYKPPKTILSLCQDMKKLLTWLQNPCCAELVKHEPALIKIRDSQNKHITAGICDEQRDIKCPNCKSKLSLKINTEIPNRFARIAKIAKQEFNHLLLRLIDATKALIQPGMEIIPSFSIAHDDMRTLDLVFFRINYQFIEIGFNLDIDDSHRIGKKSGHIAILDLCEKKLTVKDYNPDNRYREPEGILYFLCEKAEKMLEWLKSPCCFEFLKHDPGIIIEKQVYRIVNSKNYVDKCPYCNSNLSFTTENTEIRNRFDVIVDKLKQPKIVILCGSTRFYETYRLANKRETLAGNIVLTCGYFEHSGDGPITEELRARLNELHRAKMNMADEALILNVDGYIGKTTAEEIEYLKANNKPIHYLETP